MIRPAFFMEQYAQTCRQIKESTRGISQIESLQEIISGVNCLNWQVGHVVVARTNFLVILDVPSIWTWDMIKIYIPSSAPISETSHSLAFQKLLEDLDKTQALLVESLNKVDTAGLQLIKEDETVAERLAFYAAHEAWHAGKIELISRLLKQR